MHANELTTKADLTAGLAKLKTELIKAITAIFAVALFATVSKLWH